MAHQDVRQRPAAPALNIPGVEALIVDYGENLRQPLHLHDHASITLVLRGELEESSSRTSEHATPLVAVIKTARTPHNSAYGANGCRTLQVNFRPGFDFEGSRPFSECALRHAGSPTIAALLTFLRCSNTASAAEKAHAELALLETVLEFSEQYQCVGTVPKWLLQTKEAIDSSAPTARWTLSELSEVAGVHPVHITRLFKRFYGCTIREYLRGRRFRAATRAVAQNEFSLSEIAHQFGYADQAHFCRIFRSETKFSAREYRKLLTRLDS